MPWRFHPGDYTVKCQSYDGVVFISEGYAKRKVLLEEG